MIRQYIRTCLQEGPGGQLAIIDKFHGSGHSPDHIDPYVALADNDGGKKKFEDGIKRGRTLKQAFAQYADRDFLNSLKYVHWTWPGETEVGSLLRAASRGSVRDEISCRAYLPAEHIGQKPYNIGFVVKGYVTFLANDHDHVYSGPSKDYSRLFPGRKRDSGANKGIFAAVPKGRDEPSFVLDDDDWAPRHEEGTRLNEALVDNWTIEKIIAPKKENLAQQIPIELKRYEMTQIPVVIFA